MPGPQHLHGTSRLSKEAYDFIANMIRRRGTNATARALGTVVTTIDRLMGPGVQRATRERVEQRIRDLQTANAAGPELVCTGSECECSGTVEECCCIPDRPEHERACESCGADLQEAAE